MPILLSGKDEQVANSVGVPPLVVVPRNQLDKVLVKRDTRSGIEDGGRIVSNEISGND